MPTAIVLVNTDVGAETSLKEKIGSFPEVKEVYLVYGAYDIVAMIESGRMEELRDIVIRRIRRLQGVTSTSTLIVMEGP